MSITFYAGQKLRASDLQGIIDDHLRVTKPTSTTRISTATPSADPHLVLPLKANYTYIVRGVMYSTSGTTPDIQFVLSFPSGATTPFGMVRLVTGASPTGDVDVGAYSSATSGSSAIAAAGTTGVQTSLLEATVVMGSTAGDLSVLWAQFVNTASNTVLEAGSYIMATRIR